MPRQNYTDITFVLDRSGSMETIREATIQGFNDFVQEQRAVPGDGCWSMVQFDGEYEQVFSCCNQDNVPLLTSSMFQPRGSTALVDAVCRTIDETGQRLARLNEDLRPSKVLIVVMTDGHENASTDFTAQQLQQKIKHQREKYGWQFVFLGANQDAIATAAQYGISKGSAMTYQHTSVGVTVACNAVSRGTRSWKLEGNETAKDLLLDPDDVSV